jgi:hypothetical protein
VPEELYVAVWSAPVGQRRLGLVYRVSGFQIDARGLSLQPVLPRRASPIFFARDEFDRVVVGHGLADVEEPEEELERTG